MRRRLTPSDFSDVWELARPHIDLRLKPDLHRGREAYMRLISDASNFAQGEWERGRLFSVGIVTAQQFAYAGKSFGTVQLWVGPLAMLDAMVEWWDGRAVMRCLSLQFPRAVRKGMYRALEKRGFVREGDMNMLWRQ